MTYNHESSNTEDIKEKNQKKIFSENLNKLLQDREKSQLEVAKDIDVAPQTFNSWVKGVAIPRMGKVQRLADYFHVEKSTLLDEPREAIEFYTAFKDQKDAELAEKVVNNKSLANLVDLLTQLPEEDVSEAAHHITQLMGLRNKK
jgi:SOS-response transcriptional repressor, lexA